MTPQDHIRLLSSTAAKMESLALGIETCARMDKRVIRDGQIIDAPASEQMRRAHLLREWASVVKGVSNAMENDPCSTEGRVGVVAGCGAQQGFESQPVLKPGHGSENAGEEAAIRRDGPVAAESPAPNAVGDAGPMSEAPGLAEPAALPPEVIAALLGLALTEKGTEEHAQKVQEAIESASFFRISLPASIVGSANVSFPGYHSKPHDSKTCPLCQKPDDYPCTCGNGCNPGMCTDERDFDEPVWEEA